MKAPEIMEKGGVGGGVQSQVSGQDKEGSLRERKKSEKLNAILDAARTLFTSNGYEATKLRDVAKLADVGFGTVFSYSKDKSGLLSMLVVEDLQRLPPPFAEVDATEDILEQLTKGFLTIYRFWARSPELSRVVLPQMEFPQSNPFASAIRARRGQIKTELATWIARCQSVGRVGPEIDATQAADTVFAIFTSCLREWIGSESLDENEARARLLFLLSLPVSAMCAHAEQKKEPRPIKNAGARNATRA